MLLAGLLVVAAISPALASSSGKSYSWHLTPTGTAARLRGLSAVSADVAWASGSLGTVVRTTSRGATWQQVGPPGTSSLQFRDIEAFDADRAVIVQNCRQSEENRIVVTHGTDTMTETAAAIARAVSGKTVVLTGAMIPYAFGSSDGLFNLGSALSFVQALPAGVYIAMNGKCFRWDRVRKNRERGEFEEIT